ncbi:MAG: PKD domain-containing protein [Deinococcaceae bacterium]
MKPFSQLFTRLSDLSDRFSFQGCLTMASTDSTAISGLSLFKDLDSSSLFKTPFIQIQRNLSGKATYIVSDGMSSSSFSGNLDKPNCFSLTYTDPSLELKEGPSLSSLSLVKQLNTSLPYPFKAGLYLQSTTDTASASFTQVSLNSLPEPTSANVSLDLPIGDVSSGMIFDASNSSGDDLTYAWDFGDGSTSTEPFVQHTYANSGKYTVSLTVKGKDGLSKTVSNDVTILPKFNETSLPDLNFHGKSTASFTFPELPTGFEYKIDLGDGSAPKTTRSFIHSFPKLGISNITIEVLDKRPMPVAPLTAADPVVYRKYTWLNHWEAKPKATMFVETTGGKDIPFGISPLAVSFDATGSTGSSLTYAWDFGDGTTGTGSKVSHTFQEGQYVVTLQVKDSFGQTDEYRAYVAARGKDSYTKSTFTYPTLMPFAPLAAETEEKSLPTTAFVGPKNVVFESQAVDTFNDYMPYVIHKSAKATQVATRWNPWSMGGSYRLSFCDSSKFFYNGFEKATVYKAVSAVDPIFCEFMRGTAADIGAIQDRADSEFFLTGSLFFQKYNFDVFSGLRVPKVMLGIVPDRVLSGEYASPYLLENTYVDPTSGKTEMMLRVLVRQSESSKRLTFKVPVYAVNDTGNWVKQANGYFKGKFSGVESDCGDCVMKEGKAYFNVTIDPELYGLTGKKIDVSRVELYADPMCKTDSSPWAKVANTSYGYLMGCTTVTTSSEVPGGALPLKPFKYPILSSSTTFFGHVVFGETAKAVEEFYEFTSEGVFEDFGEFVIDMIPIVGSGKACWEAINNYMGTVVDTAVTGLVCVVATVETVSGAKGLSKVVYKAMKGSKAMGSGILADATEDIAKTLRAGKKDIDTFTKEIETTLKQITTVTKACGTVCTKIADDAITFFKSKGFDYPTSVKKLKNAIEDTDYDDLGLLSHERMEDISASLGCLNSFTANTLVWTSSGLRPISQIQPGDLVLGYDFLSLRTSFYPVSNRFQHKDDFITRLSLRTENTIETIETTPGHSFYANTEGSTGFAWVYTGNLKVGDRVKTTSGTGIVEAINTTETLADMFDLSVEDAHNFFVGTEGWLVHNANKCKTTAIRDAEKRIIEVEADLDLIHINEGTAPTSAARKQVVEDGIAGKDDAGHIVAKVLGGGGGLKANNIVPVLGRVNRGEMSEFEKKIAASVRAGKKVSVKVTLKYEDAAYKKRPSSIIYEVTIDGATDTKVIQNPHI